MMMITIEDQNPSKQESSFSHGIIDGFDQDSRKNLYQFTIHSGNKIKKSIF